MTTFEIPGTPCAKGRPRFSSRGGFVRTYTPQKTAAYEQLVALYASQAGVEPIEGPVRLSIAAYWPTKGAPRKRVPRPIEPKTTRPDIDNVAKIIADSLNGIAYKDDSQVCAMHLTKYHAPQEEQARVVVTVEPWLLGDV